MNLSNDYYFKKYGIDISCAISSIFEVCDDNDRINAIKMILDNLKESWGIYINNEQEEKEYNKLLEILEKVKELEEMRRYNFD